MLKQLSRLKPLLVLMWLTLMATLLIWWWQQQFPLSEMPFLIEQSLRGFGLYKAALIYVVIYTLRPFILFPATLLTVASGLIFGPWLGTLLTIIGENASANMAFLLGRWFGREAVEQYAGNFLNQWDAKLKDNALIAVMIMRLIMLPFDAVNFACGLTSMRQRDYAIGTAIGILPSLIGFVLLGGAAAAGVHNRLMVLALSGLFIVAGLALARYLRRREERSAMDISTASGS